MSKNIPVQLRPGVSVLLKTPVVFKEVEIYKDIDGNVYLEVSGDKGYRVISSTTQPSLYQEIVDYLQAVI